MQFDELHRLACGHYKLKGDTAVACLVTLEDIEKEAGPARLEQAFYRYKAAERYWIESQFRTYLPPAPAPATCRVCAKNNGYLVLRGQSGLQQQIPCRHDDASVSQQSASDRGELFTWDELRADPEIAAMLEKLNHKIRRPESAAIGRGRKGDADSADTFTKRPTGGRS